MTPIYVHENTVLKTFGPGSVPGKVSDKGTVGFSLAESCLI